MISRAALVSLLAAAPLAAQSAIPSNNARVKAALDIIKADKAWTFQQQMELTQIPAPPFKESARAADFKKRLEAIGLKNVRIDEVGNVIAERPGTGKGIGQLGVVQVFHRIDFVLRSHNHLPPSIPHLWFHSKS